MGWLNLPMVSISSAPIFVCGADHPPFVSFRRHLLTLLWFKFREFGSVTSLGVIEAANAGVKKLDGDKSKGEYPIH